MGRIVSGGTQRGIGVDKAILTNLTVPNLVGGVAAKYSATVGGMPGLGDVVQYLSDGSVYGYAFQAGDTAPMMAAGMALAGSLGAYDEYMFTTGGVYNAGDKITLTIDGVPYTFTCGAAETPATVATGVATVAVANTLYTVTASGNYIRVRAKLRGIGYAVTLAWTVDPGTDATVTQTYYVEGTLPDPDWNTSDIAGVVSWTQKVAGVGTLDGNNATNNITGAVTFPAATLVNPAIGAWSTYASGTGSLRLPEFTAVLTIAGINATVGFYGYFGATLGWVQLVAPTAYLAGSYAVIVPCGSAQQVMVAVTALGVGSSVSCTVQG